MFKLRPSILTFTVGFILSMSTIVYGGERKRLIFAEEKQSKYYIACENALLRHLNAPSTTGDVNQACHCVEKAFLGAETDIPFDHRQYYIVDRKPFGLVLNAPAISTDSSMGRGSTSLVNDDTRKIGIATEKLHWNIRKCLGRLSKRDQMFAFPPTRWRDQPFFDDYQGPVIPPLPGPPRSSSNYLGGLIFETILNAENVVEQYDYSDIGDNAIQSRKFNKHIDYVRQHRNSGQLFPVLRCSYQVEAENGYNRNITSPPYYFWYLPDFSDAHKMFIDGTPDDHPIRTVRLARNNCPIKEPSN